MSGAGQFFVMDEEILRQSSRSRYILSSPPPSPWPWSPKTLWMEGRLRGSHSSRYWLQVEIVIVSNGAEGGELQQGEGDEEDGYEENGAGV